MQSNRQNCTPDMQETLEPKFLPHSYSGIAEKENPNVNSIYSYELPIANGRYMVELYNVLIYSGTTYFCTRIQSFVNCETSRIQNLRTCFTVTSTEATCFGVPNNILL